MAQLSQSPYRAPAAAAWTPAAEPADSLSMASRWRVRPARSAEASLKARPEPHPPRAARGHVRPAPRTPASYRRVDCGPRMANSRMHKNDVFICDVMKQKSRRRKLRVHTLASGVLGAREMTIADGSG